MECLVGIGPNEYAMVIGNERRAEYLSAVVSALATADEDFLRMGPYDEAEAWLRGIKGIGAWSAAFILLRGLGRMERMLLDLKPFLAVLPRVYGPNETMESLSHRYGVHFGYWGIYLRTAT